MRRLDPGSGPRGALYAHFRGFAQPMFTLCCPVRVDAARLKAEGGIFPNLLHGVLGAANDVPELRQRVRVDDSGEWIAEHAVVHCTCTVARDDGSFAFTWFPWTPDREAFVAEVPRRAAAAADRPGLDLSEQHRDDLLYLSSIPWREVTATQHASTGDPLDCVPRILWGRVADGRVGVCVTAHHALVDGVHVARFLEALETRVG